MRELRGPEPVVDASGSSDTDSVDPDIRAKRSRKHNNKSTRPFQEPSSSEDEDLGEISDGLSRLPALPVAQSDVIIIGKVSGAHAYLSEDKCMVYSEFAVKVETVLKSDSKGSVQPGNVIDAERIGGAVRFPSGKTVRFRIFQQGFPKIGHKYVLFLKDHPDTESFNLLTGYELVNQKVKPLDGVGFSSAPSADLAFGRYAEADQTTLVNDLKKTIAGDAN